MGDLVSFPDDIAHLGNEFARAAAQMHDALMKSQEARAHVRSAFHNHPDRAEAAGAPFTELHGSGAQIQQLVRELGASLNEVATSYRNNDVAVANGWEQATRVVPRHGEV